MNLLTETASGPIALSPAEAAKRITQLRGQLAQADEFTRKRLQREIDGLLPVAEPERAFDACTTPDWYQPGWTA